MCMRPGQHERRLANSLFFFPLLFKGVALRAIVRIGGIRHREERGVYAKGTLILCPSPNQFFRDGNPLKCDYGDDV